MQRFIQTTLVACTLLAGSTHAEPGSHIGRRDSTPEDIAAITRVTQDFRTALSSKNAKLLSSLVLNGNILFDSPASPTRIKNVNDKLDVNFDGVQSGGYYGFAKFITESKLPVEEKFYNLKITQDGHVAWVMFDFEFVEDNKIENYGVETWQMLKNADGKWKILSVVWSSHGAPK